jgi:4-diphosphocytidyl-2-C-methyl-D-erythritol kinase
MLEERGNDLTAAACMVVPSIADQLRELEATPGCRIAQMSGSGATCFALYDDVATAEAARSIIQRNHATWWTYAGMLT